MSKIDIIHHIHCWEPRKCFWMEASAACNYNFYLKVFPAQRPPSPWTGTKTDSIHPSIQLAPIEAVGNNSPPIISSDASPILRTQRSRPLVETWPGRTLYFLLPLLSLSPTSSSTLGGTRPLSLTPNPSGRVQTVGCGLGVRQQQQLSTPHLTIDPICLPCNRATHLPISSNSLSLFGEPVGEAGRIACFLSTLPSNDYLLALPPLYWNYHQQHPLLEANFLTRCQEIAKRNAC